MSLSLRGILYLGEVLVGIFRTIQIKVHFRWFGGGARVRRVERQKSDEGNCQHTLKDYATPYLKFWHFRLLTRHSDGPANFIPSGNFHRPVRCENNIVRAEGRRKNRTNWGSGHTWHKYLNFPGITRQFQMPTQRLMVQRHRYPTPTSYACPWLL